MPEPTIRQYRIGDRLVTTGQEIEFILGQSNQAGVFITRDNQIRWEWYEGKIVPPRFEPGIACFEKLWYFLKSSVPRSKLDEPRRQLAGALRAALNMPADRDPIEAFKEVEREILATANAYSSFRYMLGSLIAAILIVATSLSLLPLMQTSSNTLVFCGLAGCFGGVVSVLVRAHKLSLERTAPLWAAALQGGSRTLLGTSFGVVIFLAIRAEVVLAFLANHCYGLISVAVAAGFSESIVPEILDNLAEQARNDIGSRYNPALQRTAGAAAELP